MKENQVSLSRLRPSPKQNFFSSVESKLMDDPCLVTRHGTSVFRCPRHGTSIVLLPVCCLSFDSCLCRPFTLFRGIPFWRKFLFLTSLDRNLSPLPVPSSSNPDPKVDGPPWKRLWVFGRPVLSHLYNTPPVSTVTLCFVDRVSSGELWINLTHTLTSVTSRINPLISFTFTYTSSN